MNHLNRGRITVTIEPPYSDAKETHFCIDYSVKEWAERGLSRLPRNLYKPYGPLDGYDVPTHLKNRQSSIEAIANMIRAKMEEIFIF